MSENYKVNPGVVLSLAVKSKVKKLADEYHAKAKKKIQVTSGTRTPERQAEAMYNKLKGGDKLTAYKDQVSAMEIKKAYDDGQKAKKGKSAIVKEMATVISAQVKKKKFISKHLRAAAVDIRSRDMSLVEKTVFERIAKKHATTVILEKIPPHWHLQF